MKDTSVGMSSKNWKLFAGGAAEPTFAFDPEPETICYRGQTLAIVRHFFELSCQVGRLPSLLGREFFRAKVSHHTIPSFEDQAVFVHDVQQALTKLEDSEVEIITLIGIYDVSHEEAGTMLGCSAGWISQRYAEAIASLTQVFLNTGLIRHDRPDRRQSQLRDRNLPDVARRLPPKKPCISVRGAGRSVRQASVRVQQLHHV